MRSSKAEGSALSSGPLRHFEFCKPQKIFGRRTLSVLQYKTFCENVAWWRWIKRTCVKSAGIFHCRFGPTFSARYHDASSQISALRS
ncbi:hypothetical protein PoB_006670500 [Plakobranchus ocellatus]|uniref:Uncharacterized protein n=1 Tax=Plakobranchus ocellatus TaxID=259542 RepID=A0AAV4D894_9GAST|nr:hypothetical protein PoB_006670500 [Plakobranchus ocellatus]